MGFVSLRRERPGIRSTGSQHQTLNLSEDDSLLPYRNAVGFTLVVLAPISMCAIASIRF